MITGEGLHYYCCCSNTASAAKGCSGIPDRNINTQWNLKSERVKG
jgi:hypothetical protein